MTDIVVEGGYAGDWLDTIVDFNFGQRFATITFQSVWDGDTPKNNAPLISIPQLGVINQLNIEVANKLDIGHKNPLVKNTTYHKETQSSYQPPNNTVTVYNTVVTTISKGGSGIAFGQTTVNTSNGVSYWSAGFTSGPGDINAWRAWEFTQLGVDTATATLFSGPTTFTPHRVPTYHEVDNAVYILNLSAIKKIVSPNISKIDFKFNTGVGPVRVPGFLGTVNYVWASVLETFTSSRFSSFPVSSLALPVGWRVPKTLEPHKSAIGTPVPNQALDYKIPL